MGNERLARLKPNRSRNLFWKVWPPGIIDLKQIESLFPYPINLQGQVNLGVLGEKVLRKTVKL